MGIIYKNSITDVKDCLTEVDLLEIETKYNFKFPKEIREHYLEYNGGTLEKEIFNDSDGFKYIFNWFIPIKYGKRNLATLLDILRVDPILPEWLIPFADDPGGDLLCFSIKEGEEGSIYYWSHEYEYGEDPEKHIWYLTRTLEEFINSMIEEQN